VHPVHTEAVTWISGKPYLVLAFFILSIYLLYQRATRPLYIGKKIHLWPYLLALGLFSYYIITSYSFFALLPLLLILSDLTFKKWLRNWKYWVPFLVILALRLVLARHAIAGRIAEVKIDLGAPLVNNPLIYLVYVLYSHLRILIWPLRLTFYYDPAILSQNLLRNYLLYLLPIIPLLVFSFRKEKRIFFALALFILLLAPAYSPLPITSLVAERYLYLPVLLLSVLAACLWEKTALWGKKFLPLLSAFFAIAMILFAARAIARNRDWQSELIFWQRTLQASPKSSRANNNLGLIYLKENDLGQAGKAFQQAILLNPKDIDALNNLALAYEQSGYLDQAASLFLEAIRLKPQYGFSYYNLANCYLSLKKPEEAELFYQEAIEKSPGLIKAYNNLANLYISKGKNQQAVLLLRQAIRVNPFYPPAYLNLSVAYFNLKDLAAARNCLDQAAALGLEIPPEYSRSLELRR